jgi:hypothetical protein
MFNIVEIFLANFLPLGSIEIKFIEALVQKLVGTDHCLLQLRKFFREAEIIEI